MHQENFVNPNNPDAHTQNNENLWKRAKKSFVDKVVEVKPCLQGICKSLFEEVRSKTRI